MSSSSVPSSGQHIGNPHEVPMPGPEPPGKGGEAGFIRVIEGHAAVLFPLAKHQKEAEEAAKKEQAQPRNKAKRIETVAANAPVNDEEGQSVFYNKAQVVNRDLSVCVLQAFANRRITEPWRKGGVKPEEGITVLEALSASGLRAIRYWQEIKHLRRVVANDIDPDAVQCIERNISFNEGVPMVSVADCMKTSSLKAPRGIVPNCDDAVHLMQRLSWQYEKPTVEERVTFHRCDPNVNGGQPTPILSGERFDAVDLDPYGTASPFLEGAVGCAKEGALLLVTCTDSAILCGNYSETCHAKYGCISMRSDSCHEIAPRIVLATLERVANKHGKFIKPLLSLHIDFYIRVFVRIYAQPAEAKLAVCKIANVAQCVRCPGHWFLPIGKARVPKKDRIAGKKRLRGTGEAADQTDETSNNDSIPKSIYAAPPDRTQNINVTCSSVQDVPARCPACGGRTTLGGPIYASPAHDPQFLDEVLDVMKEKGPERLKALTRVRGLVEAAKNELPDTPLFYKLDQFASLLQMPMPNSAYILGAICRLGYRCSHVHCEPNGIKTDCPAEVIVGVMRQYKKVHYPPKEGEVAEPTATAGSDEQGSDDDSSENEEEQEKGARAPSDKKKSKKEKKKRTSTWWTGLTLPAPREDADFTYDSRYDLRSGQTGVVMFPPNAPNWGPKARHTGVEKKEE